MKSFWDERVRVCPNPDQAVIEIELKDALGQWLWENGAKQFISHYVNYSLTEYIEEAKWRILNRRCDTGEELVFLWCLDCWGEAKMKEKIV